MLNKISNNLIEYILRFCCADEITKYRQTNKYNKNFLTVNKHIYYYCLCMQYKLIPKDRNLSKIIKEDYNIIYKNVTSFDKSYGSHQNNINCWVSKASENTMFSTIKYCIGVWWFDIRIKIDFIKNGTYEIWLKANFNNVPIEESSELNIMTDPKIDTIEHKINFIDKKTNSFEDIYLGFIIIKEPMKIELQLYDYDIKTYKYGHIFDFVYLIPVR